MEIEEIADRWEDVGASANVAGVGIKGEWLIVKFRNGMYYRYAGFASHFDDMITSDSVGRYFHQHIRHEPYERLRGEEWPDEEG